MTQALNPSPVRRAFAAGFWLLAAAAMAWQLSQLSAWGLAAAVALLPVSWAAADLTTGTVHWLLDRYGTPETPLAGPVIADFRTHHTHPRRILEGDMLESSASAAMAAAPVLAALLLAGLPAWLTVAAMVWLLGCVATNYFHLLAHMDAPPAAALWLQRRGLILSQAEHARHHSGAHQEGYCITVGWANPWLERNDIYARLERVFPPTVDTVRPHPEPGRHADEQCA